MRFFLFSTGIDPEERRTELERYRTDLERHRIESERFRTHLGRPRMDLEKRRTELERRRIDLERCSIELESLSKIKYRILKVFFLLNRPIMIDRAKGSNDIFLCSFQEY